MVWVLRADGEGEVRPGRLARPLPDNQYYVWVLEAVRNVHLRERQVEFAEESMTNGEQRNHEHKEGMHCGQQNGGNMVTIQTGSTTIHISTGGQGGYHKERPSTSTAGRQPPPPDHPPPSTSKAGPRAEAMPSQARSENGKSDGAGVASRV